MQEFIDRLESLGFYKYCDRTVIPSLKRDFQNGGCLFDLGTQRMFPFDSEDLAEGGIRDYLQRLLSFLRLQGVSVRTIEQRTDFDNLDYRITIDDTEYVVFQPSELVDIDTWGLATIRAFLLVNHMLGRAGSREKFFLVASSGAKSRLLDVNQADMAGVFLTQELFEVISNTPTLTNGKELAWFGDGEFKLIVSG